MTTDFLGLFPRRIWIIAASGIPGIVSRGHRFGERRLGMIPLFLTTVSSSASCKSQTQSLLLNKTLLVTETIEEEVCYFASSTLERWKNLVDVGGEFQVGDVHSCLVHLASSRSRYFLALGSFKTPLHRIRLDWIGLKFLDSNAIELGLATIVSKDVK